MTIGLAALCKDESGLPRVVVAADRMVTYPGLIEFEHAVRKVAVASTHAIAMAAGDTLVATRMIQDVVAAMAGTSPRIADIAAQLAQRYEQVRTQRVEEQVLSPRGLTFQAFYGNHQGFHPQLSMVADQAMMQFDLGIELLVAGVDPAGGHIFTVRNPGHVDQQWDVIGSTGIGSGAVHTLQSMIGFRHVPDCGFRETVFWVYASKKRSEAAPGVGVETDVAVISRAGVQWLSSDQVAHLGSVYNHYIRSTSDTLTQELETIDLGRTPTSPPDQPQGLAELQPEATQSQDSTNQPEEEPGVER